MTRARQRFRSRVKLSPGLRLEITRTTVKYVPGFVYTCSASLHTQCTPALSHSFVANLAKRNYQSVVDGYNRALGIA